LPADGWVAKELNPASASRYVNLEEFKRARYANALRNGQDAYRNEHFLHLLDGGLADNQGAHSLTEALFSARSPVSMLNRINTGEARHIVVISVNARSDVDSGVGSQETVPGLFKVINTIIGTPIDATTAYANATLQDLIDALKTAGASARDARGHPLFSGMRVYGISIDFDQFLPDQAKLQYDVKSIGTSWSLSNEQLHEAIMAGQMLLRQHPCYQHLLLDMKIAHDPSADALAMRNCPFSDDNAP
jgi:NTE family protein